MQVRDAMTEQPACCTPETPLSQVAQLMVRYDCGAIPVIENEQSRRLVGMITDRDITCRTVAEGRNPLEMKAGDCMSTAVVTVEPSTGLGECCERMEQAKVRRIPVVDEQGRCCGIVAQADVVGMIPERQAAELVDEISEPTGAPSSVAT